jgi:hypothetical protein
MTVEPISLQVYADKLSEAISEAGLTHKCNVFESGGKTYAQLDFRFPEFEEPVFAYVELEVGSNLNDVPILSGNIVEGVLREREVLLEDGQV